MNTPSDIAVVDLLRLAREECRRFDRFSELGDFEMHESQRLVRELVLESIEVIEAREAALNASLRALADEVFPDDAGDRR
jgi:hypothetical protein